VLLKQPDLKPASDSERRINDNKLKIRCLISLVS